MLSRVLTGAGTRAALSVHNSLAACGGGGGGGGPAMEPAGEPKRKKKNMNHLRLTLVPPSPVDAVPVTPPRLGRSRVCVPKLSGGGGGAAAAARQGG